MGLGILAGMMLAAPSGALELYALIPCDAKPSTGAVQAMCIVGSLEPGRRFSVLASKPCAGTTRKVVRIQTEVEDFDGTTVDLSCSSGLGEDNVVLFDAPVSQYQKAVTREIERSATSAKVKKRIMATPEFKAAVKAKSAKTEFKFDPTWTGTEIRFSSRTLYHVDTNETDFPSFLVSDDSIRVWGKDGYVYGVRQAFELNGTEMLEVNRCVPGTDSCGEEFIAGPTFETPPFPEESSK